MTTTTSHPHEAMHGIDIERAPILARALQVAAERAIDAAMLVTDAEQLCEMNTQTVWALFDISRECSAMASAIVSATSHLATYRIPPIDPMHWVEPTGPERHPLTEGDGKPRYEQGDGHPMIDQPSLDAARRKQVARERIRELLNDLGRHLGQLDGADPLDAFTADDSITSSRRAYAHEQWLALTRITEEARLHSAAWGANLGLDEDDALLILAQYRSLDDKGLNAAVLASGYRALSAQSAELILESEARRLFVTLELRAIEDGWSDEKLRRAHLEAISLLAGSDKPVAIASPDAANAQQLAMAFAVMVAKREAGDPLPSLSDEEIAMAIAVGDPALVQNRPEGLSDLPSETPPAGTVVEMAAILTGESESRLAVGLRGLARLNTAVDLLQAVAAEDTEAITDITRDAVIGSAIGSAAKWLLPRTVGGPVVAVALLLITLAGIEEEPVTGPPPPGPPRVGSTSSNGVRRSNGPYMNAAGIPDLNARP